MFNKITLIISITTILTNHITFALPAAEPKLKSEEFIEEQNENEISQDTRDLPLDESDLLNLSEMNLKIFGNPDNITTKSNLENFDPNGNVNPEELGTYLEGDILIPPSNSRNGMLSRFYRWPRGIVPYEVRGTFTPKELAYINRGFEEYHKKTCIRFKPRTTEKNYISVVNSATGCWSSIGKVGGRQEVNLQTPACLARGSGTFMHELMHALGFLHEQNRYERDGYITIKYENIQKNALHNFDKSSPATTYAFGVPYDFGSIMHYSAYAFSSNGKPTIVPKENVSVMGQRTGFSAHDLKKINSMYKCTRRHKAMFIEGQHEAQN